MEGFEAKVIIDGAATVVRIMAQVKRDAPRLVEQEESACGGCYSIP